MKCIIASLTLALALGATGCSSFSGPQPGLPSSSRTRVPATAASAESAPGWQALQARDGSFRCLLPEGARNSYAPQLEQGGPGTYLVQYSVGTGSETTTFAASWMAQSPEMNKAGHYVEQLEAHPEAGRVLDQQSIEVEGSPGLEVTYAAESGPETGLLVMRLVPGQGRLFMAAVGRVPRPPEGREKEFRDQARIFFDHFRPELKRTPLEDPFVPVEWKEFPAEDGSFAATLPAQFKGTAWGSGRYSAECEVPGRRIKVAWMSPDDDLDKLKADLATEHPELKEVHRNGIARLEYTTTAEFEGRSAAFVSHVLVLESPGRRFTVEVQGMEGDPALEGDARKVFDSLEPGP